MRNNSHSEENVRTKSLMRHANAYAEEFATRRNTIQSKILILKYKV